MSKVMPKMHLHLALGLDTVRCPILHRHTSVDHRVGLTRKSALQSLKVMIVAVRTFEYSKARLNWRIRFPLG